MRRIKFILKITAVIFVFIQCGEQKEKIIVEENTYEGIVFTEYYTITFPDGEEVRAVYFIPNDVEKEWTPNIENIRFLENQLAIYNQRELGFPNLRPYFRQYVGYIDSLGGKNIWINLIALKEIEDEKLKKMPLLISDADSSVFSLNFSVSDSTFFDLRFW